MMATTAAAPTAAGQYGATCSNTIYVIVSEADCDTGSRGREFDIPDCDYSIDTGGSRSDSVYVDG